jgi:hypothetical protein
LRIICRWSEADLASGIADLAVYPLLKARKIPLYLHPRIHLKLYVFGNNTAFTSSANATGRGLGLVPDANIEVGAKVVLQASDWRNLFSLFKQATLVNDGIYAQALAYQQKYGTKGQVNLPPLQVAVNGDAEHSIASLPASPNPATFATWHSNPRMVPPEEYSAYIHDAFLYEVPPGLTRGETLSHVRARFRNHPFVKDVTELIKSARTAPFGRVKAWLQETCSDSPLPYRWELTRNTQILYDWLSDAFEEVSWDRPGYSMVIYWNRAEPGPKSKQRAAGDAGGRRSTKTTWRRA